MTEFCACTFDWYQSDGTLTIEVRQRGRVIDDCHTEFFNDCNKNQIIKLRVKDEVIFSTCLYGDVEPNKIVTTCTPFKIIIKLQKKLTGTWPKLSAESERQDDNGDEQPTKKEHRNWEKIAKEAESEEFESMDPTYRLFKRIYENSDEDGRRAMMKSMYESNGTTCSTNWADVSKRKIEPGSPAGESDPHIHHHDKENEMNLAGNNSETAAVKEISED